MSIVHSPFCVELLNRYAFGVSYVACSLGKGKQIVLQNLRRISRFAIGIAEDATQLLVVMGIEILREEHQSTTFYLTNDWIRIWAYIIYRI